MSDINLFLQATRTKLRFPTPRGDIDVEQVWDLPLSSANPRELSLDDVAKATAARLRTLTEDSFVNNAPNRQKAIEELRLEVVKAIIGIKLAERDETARQAHLRQQRDVIAAELAKRQDQKLSGLSTEELQAQAALIQQELGN